MEQVSSNLLMEEFEYDYGSPSAAFTNFIRDNFIFSIQTSIEIAIPPKVRQIVFYK